MRKTRKATAAALAMLVAIALATRAQANDALKSIPAGAYGFAVVNDLAAADAKVKQLAQRVGAPPASLLMMLKGFTGATKGLDDNGTLTIACFPLEERQGGAPATVAFVPVSDFAAFAEALGVEGETKRITNVTIVGQSCVIAQKGDLAILAPAHDRVAVKLVLREKKGIDVGDPAFLAGQDAAVVLLRDGVKKITKLAIDGIAEAKKTIEQVQEMQGSGNMMGVAEGLDLYAKLFAFVGKETDYVIVGAKLQNDGSLRVVKRVRFLEGGEAAKLLQKPFPAIQSPFAGLPAQPFVAALDAKISGDTFDAIMDWSMDFVKSHPNLYGIKPEDVDKLTASTKEMMGTVRGVTFLMGVGQRDDPLYQNMLMTMTVEDSAKYIEQYRKMMDEYVKAATEQPASMFGGMTMEDVTLDGGQSALKLTMDMSRFVEALDPDGKEAVEAMFDKLFGNGGKMSAYIIAADKETVVLGYVSPESAVKTVEAIKAGKTGLGGDDIVKQTTSLLNQKAQCVGVWSVDGTIAFVTRIFGMIPDLQGMTPQIPAFPAAPPIGFSMTASAEGIDGEMVVPAALIDAVGAYVKQLQQQPPPPRSRFDEISVPLERSY